jgi:hypothetical protein
VVGGWCALEVFANGYVKESPLNIDTNTRWFPSTIVIFQRLKIHSNGGGEPPSIRVDVMGDSFYIT